MLWGNAKLDLTTEWTADDKLEFESTHKLNGKFEFAKIYEIEGTQTVEGELKPFQMVKIEEDSKFKVTVDDKENDYNHETEIKGSIKNTGEELSLKSSDATNSFEYDGEIKFSSNYLLKTASYKGNLKGDDTSIKSSDTLTFNYNKKDYEIVLGSSASGKDDVLKGNVKLTTSFDILKKVEVGADVNTEKMTASVNGNYNDKSVKVTGGITCYQNNATDIYGDPDAKFTLTVKPSDNINAFKDSSVTLKAFYRMDLMKFFDLRYALNFRDSTSSKFKIAAGIATLSTGGFEIRSNIPLPKFGKKFEAVLMLEGNKPNTPAPVAEVKLFAGPIKALIKSTARKTNIGGMQYQIDMLLITKKRVIVAKNTALVIEVEKLTPLENKGKITMKKGKDADFDMTSSFEYKIALKDLKLKTKTDYTFFENNRRIRLDIQSIFDLRAKKRFEVEVIPNRTIENEKFYVLIEHDGEPLWNFKAEVIASVPLLKSTNKGSIRLFYSPDGTKTTTSELQANAIFAFDLKLKSTLEVMKSVKIQAAFSNNKKGKISLSADTKLLKKSLDATVDATEFPNFVLELILENKKITIAFKGSGKSGRFVATVGEREIGSADFRYISGKLLKIDASIELPKQHHPIEFTFKQKHANGNWDYKDWFHKSSFSVWTKDNRNIKFSQDITFKYPDDELVVDANIKSTIKAIENLKAKLKVNTGSTPSSFLSLKVTTFGNRLKVFHDVPNWKNVLEKFVTNVAVNGAKRQRFVFELKRDSKVKAHLKLSNNVFEKFKLLQYTRKAKDEIFVLTAAFGHVSLKSNLISLIYDFVLGAPHPRHIFLQGDVPGFRRLKVSFKVLKKLSYEIKMRLGEGYMNIYPTVTVLELDDPIRISFNVKITSHLPQLSSCVVTLNHKSASNLMSAKHSLSLMLNGRNPFSHTLKYQITEADFSGNYKLMFRKYVLEMKAKYNQVTKKYSHNIGYGLRNRRARAFTTTAECEPYRFGLDNAKCILTTTLRRQKMIIALVNTALNSITKKSIKLAWNEYKRQSVQIATTLDESSSQVTKSDLRIYTPLRSFQLMEEFSKIKALSTTISGRTINRRTGAVLGHVTVKIDQERKGRMEETTTLRISSTLLKEEVKFVSVVKKPIVLKTSVAVAQTIDVRSDMYIGASTTSKLSLTFKMEKFSELKSDLSLLLVGGSRHLKLFTRFDLTKPVKTISIGADAMDWKRILDIVYEDGKRLETTVDSGTSKQTIRMSSERMAQNNGYRNILELDYPEVNGYLKIISQVSRYPLSLLVIVHAEKNKPENKLVINGRFMNSRNILMEIKRFKKSSISMETYTQITLDKQNVITKLKWRPGVINDFKTYILRELRPTTLTQYLKNRGLGLREVIKRVIQEILAPLKGNVRLRVAEAAGFAITRDYDTIKAFTTALVTIIRKSANDSAAVEYALTTIKEGLNKTINFINGLSGSEAFAAFNQTTLNELISAQYKLLYAKLGKKLEGLNEELLIAILNKVKERLATARRKFNEWLEATTVKTKAWVERRKQFLNNIKAGLAKRFKAIISGITSDENTKTLVESMKSFGNQIKEMFKQAVPKEFIDKLVNAEEIKEFKETMKKLKQLISWSKRPTNRKSQESDWSKSVKLLLEGDLKKAFEVYFKPKLTGIKRWDPQKGFINAQVHLPYNIKSLQSVPLAIYAYTQSRAMEITNEIRTGTFQLGDIYLRLNELLLRYSSPAEFLRSQLPPYPSYAYLTGSQHFITFDGVNVEHSGECTYVLAHDYVNHSFTVLGRYVKIGRMMRRKDIIVQTPNVAVYIDTKGRIKMKLRGSSRLTSKLPPLAFKAEVLVTRLKNRLTLIGPSGLSVACYVNYDVCRIGLNEWAHARVNGLLGNNDYERGNDIVRRSDGFVSFNTHTNYWRAGKCYTFNNAVVERRSKSSAPGFSYCRRVFMNSRSSFSRCYFKVPPETYLQACLNMYKMASRKGVCSIFKMYADKCKMFGIRTPRLPNYCITCGRRSQLSWTRLRPPISGYYRSRNFVFIVENKPCMPGFLGKLSTFVRVMSRRNPGDVYSVIGFGGIGIYGDVSTHMVGNTRIEGNYNQFMAAMRRMDFRGTLRDPELSHQAVRKSLILDDIPTKPTIFVLLSCTGCSQVVRMANYGPLLFQLRKRGIPLHYITPHSFGTYAGQQVIGIDNMRLFGRRGRQITNTGRRPSSFSTVNYRKDICEALARGSGGSIWSIEALKRENSFGISRLKSVVRQVQWRRRRRCSCLGNNYVRCSAGR